MGSADASLARTDSKPRRGRLRPLIKRHGGKWYVCGSICDLMPPHRVYVEPYLGGGSVLLNKPRAGAEVAGDLEGWLVDAWRALASSPAELIAMLASTPYTEERFVVAGDEADVPDPVRRAWAFVVRHRFSRGGMGKDFAWSGRLRGTRRPGGAVPGDANAWDTFLAMLPRLAARVRGVEFAHAPALETIARHAAPDTLMYLDPPYIPERRTARKVYENEMTLADHARLLDLVLASPGMFMVSGYSSPLYEEKLARWRRVEWELPNNSGQGAEKQRRTEVLWMSPSCGRRMP